MADFDVVTSRLATGAAVTDRADVQALVDVGVTAVVDCRGDFDDAPLLASHPALLYLWNGTADDGQPKPPAWFAATLNFVLPLLARPGQLVYLHCHGGINRGPSACYAAMRAVGFTADDALATIRRARPVTRGGIRYAADADRAVDVLGYVPGRG